MAARVGVTILCAAVAACSSRTSAPPAPSSIDPASMAIVAGDDGVVTVDLATGRVGAPWPIEGTPRAVAIEPGGELALVALDGLDTLARVRATDSAAAGALEIEQSPTDVVFGRDGIHAFVLSGPRVLAVDVNAMSILVHLTACDAPRAMAVSRDGERGFVACEGEGIAWLDLDDLDEVPYLWPDGADDFAPRGIAIAADDLTLLVLDAATRAVDLFDVTRGVVSDTIPLGDAPHGLGVSADGATWAVTTGSSTLAVIDAKTRRITATKSIDGCRSIGDVAETKDGWVLACDHAVVSVRASDLSVSSSIAIPFAASTIRTRSS